MKNEVTDNLEKFTDAITEAKKSLELLRESVKKETSRKIGENITAEKFEEANQLIEQLSFFVKLEFQSNANVIESQAKALLSGVKEEFLEEKIEETKFPKLNFLEERKIAEEKISRKEMDIIKEIGENGYFDQRQLGEDVEEQLISLNIKKILEIEEFVVNEKIIYNFELTPNGKKLYFENFGKVSASNRKRNVLDKFGNIEKGLLLYEAEKKFKEIGYTIEEINEERLEIVKNKKTIYLTPDFGVLTEENYKDVLNKTNQLKRIGFLCETKESKKKAKKAVSEWVDENPTKKSFLKVHYVTLESLKEQQVFEIENY